MKSACILARVSTPEQAAEDRTSLDSQEAYCRRVAEEMGYSVLRVIRGDVSGANTLADRPDALEALELYAAGGVQAIFVRCQDRLERSVAFLLELLVAVEKADVRVHGDGVIDAETRQSLDPDDEGAQYKSVGSGAERVRIFRRTYEHKIEAAKRGRPLGGVAPFGYKREYEYTPGHAKPTSVRLVLNEVEPPVVREIFQWAVQGLGTATIAYRLQEAHVPTRFGGTWRRATVNRMIRNPVYKGAKLLFGEPPRGKAVRLVRRGVVREPIEVPCPRIVTDEDWEKAQRCIVERRSRITVAKHDPFDPEDYWPFQGLVQCSADGHTYHKLTNRLGVRYYYCAGTTSKENGRSKCQSAFRWIKQERLLDELCAALEETTVEQAVAHYMESLDREEAALVHELGRRQLTSRGKMEDALKRLARAYADGGFDDEEYAARKAQLKGRLATMDSNGQCAALEAVRREKADIQAKLQAGGLDVLGARMGFALLDEQGHIVHRLGLRSWLLERGTRFLVEADGSITVRGASSTNDTSSRRLRSPIGRRSSGLRGTRSSSSGRASPSWPGWPSTISGRRTRLS